MYINVNMFASNYPFDFHVAGLIVEYESGSCRVIPGRTTIFYRHNRVYVHHGLHYCDYAGGCLSSDIIKQFSDWVASLTPFDLQNWFVVSQLGIGVVKRYVLNSRIDLHLDSQFFKQCKNG